jgi:hypothetical protein
VQDKKEERKAAEVRKLGIYHGLMRNDDGIVHLLHTPAAAKNMEDNRRKKERKKETEPNGCISCSIRPSCPLSSSSLTKACLPLHPTLAVLAAALAAEETLLSHSPSLSLSLSLKYMYIHTYINVCMCTL